VVGVAPGAPLTGVKVLDCNGSGFTSEVIKGVDWVTANAIKPAIANMSLSGDANQTLDSAVMKSADSGVFYSLAAGNFGTNACNYSPGRAGTHDGVMTTAATDSKDLEASFSNYGQCVDIWAPGVNVLSTWLGGGTNTLSGTSMAAPHVGGSAALYLSSNPTSSAAAVEAVLKSNAVLVPGSTTCTGKGKNRQCTGGGTSKDGRVIQIVNDRLY
jgi:subtilisin family serine protease